MAAWVIIWLNNIKFAIIIVCAILAAVLGLRDAALK